MSEKLAVNKNQFFLDAVAWWIPSVLSTFLIFRFVVCRTESAVSEFPETAAIGGILAQAASRLSGMYGWRR